MNKKNFNNLGLQLLLQELYAWPQEPLTQEALLAKQDFAAWLENNFELDEAQLYDLRQASSAFLQEMGFSVADFLENRKPITLVKQPVLSAKSNGTGRGKLYEKTQKSTLTYIPEQGMLVSETLEISIGYLSEPLT
jgi:hypothetical protein